MPKETIKIGAEVDRETDLTLRTWCKVEQRSKCRHSAIILQNAARLRKLGADLLLKMPVTDLLRRMELVND